MLSALFHFQRGLPDKGLPELSELVGIQGSNNMKIGISHAEPLKPTTFRCTVITDLDRFSAGLRGEPLLRGVACAGSISWHCVCVLADYIEGGEEQSVDIEMGIAAPAYRQAAP